VLATIIIRRQIRQLSLIKDLENAKKAALQSVQAKDQFMANMSHEIRTPLNAIKGFGKILARTPLNGDQQKYTSIISTASENLLNIVNDILDFSKIETGNLVMKVKVFELAAVLDEVEQMFTPLAHEKELQLIFSPDRSLPAFVKSDPVRLRQILMNLLSNAIKFTNKGYVKLSVKAVERKAGRVKVRFTVSDTGVGIPAEKLATVFERFEQLDDSLTRQQGGTGLGLAITKQLVEALGGTIHVKSEISKGSVFTAELEFEKITKDSIPEEAVDAAAVIKPDLASARVLVAEDNMMNQLLVTRMLERYQVETDIAENGEDALVEIKRKKYDMVLMDVQMPKMDGLSATRIIRKEISTAIPVIAMTAHVLPGEREKCLAAGMNDYLAKPLDEMELVEMLKKYFTVRNKKPGQANECDHTRWLNYNYLNSICNNEEEKVDRIVEELGRQLPAESLKLERIIARKQVDELEKLHHYLKSTLACFTSEAVPVKIMEELGKMLQLKVEEELVWKKAKELADSMQAAAAVLSVIITGKQD
jgi:CheY-like chemotaxis protein